MDRAHWLSRKRASVAMAEKAMSSVARLVHYELAGRYSVKAADAAPPQLHVEDEPPLEAYAERKPVASPSPERS